MSLFASESVEQPDRLKLVEQICKDQADTFDRTLSFVETWAGNELLRNVGEIRTIDQIHRVCVHASTLAAAGNLASLTQLVKPNETDSQGMRLFKRNLEHLINTGALLFEINDAASFVEQERSARQAEQTRIAQEASKKRKAQAKVAEDAAKEARRLKLIADLKEIGVIPQAGGQG